MAEAIVHTNTAITSCKKSLSFCFSQLAASGGSGDGEEPRRRCDSFVSLAPPLWRVFLRAADLRGCCALHDWPAAPTGRPTGRRDERAQSKADGACLCVSRPRPSSGSKYHCSPDWLRLSAAQPPATTRFYSYNRMQVARRQRWQLEGPSEQDPGLRLPLRPRLRRRRRPAPPRQQKSIKSSSSSSSISSGRRLTSVILLPLPLLLPPRLRLSRWHRPRQVNHWRGQVDCGFHQRRSSRPRRLRLLAGVASEAT